MPPNPVKASTSTLFVLDNTDKHQCSEAEAESLLTPKLASQTTPRLSFRQHILPLALSFLFGIVFCLVALACLNPDEPSNNEPNHPTRPRKPVFNYETKTITLFWTATNTSQSPDGVPTSLHFHGMIQRDTAFADGPAAVTQCPVAPGATFVYNFTTEETAGSFWWHAHYHLHILDGLRVKTYSQDVAFQLADWYHEQSEDLLGWYLDSTTNPGGNEPVWNSGLINGVGQFNCSDAPDIACETREPFVQVVDPESTVRLRILNTATFAAFLFSVDAHSLTVIEVDGVGVVPYVVDSLTINVGQRYSVLITASQKPGNYWIRAKMYHGNPWTSMPHLPPGFNPDVRAILRYKGITQRPLQMIPTLQTPTPPTEQDTYLYQFDFQTLPGDTYQKAYNTLSKLSPTSSSSQKWIPIFTSSSFYQPAKPDAPLLLQAHTNGSSWIPPPSANAVWLSPDRVIDFVIVNTDPGEHPMHIHGHVFWVLATGVANSTRNIPRQVEGRRDALRRDVVTVPACPNDGEECYPAGFVDFPEYEKPVLEGRKDRYPVAESEPATWFGYSVIRMVSDNPGLWLFHCHISWHMATGLGISLVESIEELQKLEKPWTVTDTCDSFGKWKGESEGSTP
ncbi:Cupredoxin [Rhizoclosmatium globosum]|uniref:Cupredoxin n=1 Tax=Rhizoclosmatium globosum TaxID=329046 RepID=A0A1Y2C3T4_9FUNG|nr:Cupredoxin [Rhizoclosmatium globosum]|eukprot:ORY41700.1 Cupredoxin [Rhizoclosmatium globosum]